MSERNEFERDVREALRAEAEAGPDYRTALHARVMDRVWAATHDQPAAPPRPAVPLQRMAMMALGAAIVLLAALTIIALTRGH